MPRDETHSVLLGYLFWIFGFTGAHRFYFGKPVTGTIWLFTLGLFGIGWLVDAFLVPTMCKEAQRRYVEGPRDYDVSWLLLVFFGVFGVHRFYLGKIVSGLVWLFSGGLFGLGLLYDFWTLNEQVSEANGAR